MSPISEERRPSAPEGPIAAPVAEPTRRGRANVWLELGGLALLLGHCLFWFSDTIADPDLWGHVRFGQGVARGGPIIQEEIYSYRNDGHFWINHEWLAETIFAAAYDRWEARGLIGLKLAVGLAVLGPCWGQARSRGLGPHAATVLLVLLSVPFRMGLGTVRPQMFTYLFFLVQLLLLERAPAGRIGALWALPLLWALWANLHGGILAGAGALGIYLGARAVREIRSERGTFAERAGRAGRLALFGVVCIAALLCNPYGARLIGFLLREGLGPRPEILEWKPIGLASLPGVFYTALLAAVVVGVAGSRRARRPELLAVLFVTAALPLVAGRHWPLFVLAAVVLGSEHIADCWGRWRRPSARPPRPGRRPKQALAAVELAAFLVLAGLSVARWDCIRIEPFYFNYPSRAVEWLRRAGARGNMAVPFDWGEYVIWHLGPRVKVSIDGRRETAYSDAAYRQSRAFETGADGWDSLLKTGPRTDFVLLPNGAPTVLLLGRTRGWLALYRDTCCTIFVREGLPDLERIVKAPVPAIANDGRGLCFPGPSTGADRVTRAADGWKANRPTRATRRFARRAH